MVRAVVFDIGGVLEVTPDTGWMARWAEDLGLAPEGFRERIREPAYEGSRGQITLEEFVSAVREAFGLDDEQTSAFMDDLWHEYLGTLNTELLAYFSGLRGRVRTGILSNSFVGAREREQARYGFEDHCEVVVYSHEEGLMKPDPAFYAVVCERLDVLPEEVVFLDDVQMCVEGARAVGMTAILFENNASAIAEIEALLQSAGV